MSCSVSLSRLERLHSNHAATHACAPAASPKLCTKAASAFLRTCLTRLPCLYSCVWPGASCTTGELLPAFLAACQQLRQATKVIFQEG